MKQVPMPMSKFASYLVGSVLVLVPFHAFLTVWGSSLVGHYTLLRLWDDAALLVLLATAGFWLATDVKVRNWVADSRLAQLVWAYVALSFLLGLISILKGDVTPKALVYGLLVNLRFLAWFLVVTITAKRSDWLARNWARLLLVPATVVAVFAVLQYAVLPHDFLSHFGYNAKTTIAPIETINHNSHYIRTQSTLRGANPLGAYLVVVLSAIGTLFACGKRRPLYVVFGVVALAALYASGSRSAWIGAVIAVAVALSLGLRTRRARGIFGVVTGVSLVLLASLFLLVKNNVSVQNELLHTQTHSTVTTSSNGAHASAVAAGVKDVVRQPFGDGPGTAGPASVYNGGRPARISEDYYVQIAQETGWLGLALFMSIVVLVGIKLYRRVRGSQLALALFAALIGVSFVGLLSHVWTDDTLAFTWWGLAGIALALPDADRVEKGEA